MVEYYKLNPFLMKKLFNFTHQIKHFKQMFDARTYKTFVGVVKAMIQLREWKQADVGLMAEKTLRQIQYFFNQAKWCGEELNKFRLRFLRNKPDFRDRKSDFVVADGTVIEKDKDAKQQEWLYPMYSNLSKGTVNGIKVFGASVHTKNGPKFILDFMLFLKGKWSSEFTAWKNFLTKISKKTSAWLFVFDSGFRNKYLIKHVYYTLKRMFLVRILPTQCVLVKDPKRQQKRKKKTKYSVPGRICKKIQNFLKDEDAIQVENGKIWIIPHVMINAWRDVFRKEVTVVVYHRNGFKKPLVLCVSKNELILDEALEFIQTYYKRWGIEQLFKELKSWFCWEKFKVTSLKAIEKYLYLVVFVHSLLSQKQAEIEHIPKLKQVIQIFLKTTRNIKEFTVTSLKLFFESMIFPASSIRLKHLALANNLTFAYGFL